MAQPSRIFIRGLPPSLKEDDFKSHFARSSPITDAKFLPHRRIGYIGYKSPDAAAKAVKYFNKSFIRMSRIGVELAKPIQELKREKTQPLSSQSENQGQKRKGYDVGGDGPNQKLEEFLGVMAPSSKSKMWSNEDALGLYDGPAVEGPSSTLQQKNESAEEYEPVPKKRKTSPRREESDQAPRTRDVTTQSSEVVDDSSGPKSPEMTDNSITADPAAEPAAATSDADWLRSRTSRLLGLIDEDEVDAMGTVQDDDESVRQHDGILEVPKQQEDTPVADASSQTDETLSKAMQGPEKPEQRQAAEKNTGRLFVRNLSYEATEDDLRACFSQFGSIQEVHIPMNPRSYSSKGYAYVQFDQVDAAKDAIRELDGKTFQGRILHILPAAVKKEHSLDDYAISKLPLKKQNQIRRKAEASSATFKWNSMYMNPDAIISSISTRLGMPKSEILDPTSSDAAVKQAHAETNVIQETKAYFSANGVDLESFKTRDFSDNVILVKNFSYGTTPTEIKKMFEEYGTVTKLLMPPSATIAIVELEQVGQAKAAFRALAYRKLKDSVLFLEKAPKSVFGGKLSELSSPEERAGGNRLSAADLLEQTHATEHSSSTLFVRNLNFSTSTERLREVFKPLNGLISALVKTKTDPKKPGQTLSMGFGFVEFRTKEDAQSALATMNGHKLDGHELLIKASHKALDAAEERRKEDMARKIAGRRTKIIIKNLPFETTKKDVRALFSPYGQLRSVRVPKKFDSSTRGFAFADFVTAREAENAMDVLQGTHLLGRRLNLDFAIADTVDPEEEIQKMQNKVGSQTEKVALRKLTAPGRKKFTLERDDDVGAE